MAAPVILLVAIGAALGASGCGFFGMPEDDNENRGTQYFCPELENFPPNQAIDYNNLSGYSYPGPLTWSGKNMSSFVDGLSERANSLGGNGLDYFKSLNDLLEEIGYIPDPKPKEINDLICKRTAEEILTSELGEDGKVVYSGCDDVATLARAALVMIGYEVVYISSVHESYLNGGQEFRGHAFLEVKDAFSGELFLYDPTAGTFYKHYDSRQYTLPGGYLVFAKGLDLWDMTITSSSELNTCLRSFRSNYYNQSEEASFHEIDYPVLDLNE